MEQRGGRLLFESCILASDMFWQQGEHLHLGAEASVHSGNWMGISAISKQRRARSWRHPDLDDKLGRRRMIAEARLLIRLHRAGLPVPALLDLDVENKRMIIKHISGKPLIEVLREQTEVDKLMHEVGRVIRMLHRNAVTHGDLSTNNILIETEKVHLIDFGLAAIEYDVERFGVDLHVLHEILGASHPDHPQAMNRLLEGYLSLDEIQGPPNEGAGGKIPSAAEVVSRLDEIKTRVRYHG